MGGGPTTGGTMGNPGWAWGGPQGAPQPGRCLPLRWRVRGFGGADRFDDSTAAEYGVQVRTGLTEVYAVAILSLSASFAGKALTLAFDLLSRRTKDREKYGDRLPPGQKVVEDWPVLTYGGTPRIDPATWRLRIHGAVERDVEFSWEQFGALPAATVRGDIHCVTSWSRMDNEFEGVLVRGRLNHFKPLPSATQGMA